MLLHQVPLTQAQGHAPSIPDVIQEQSRTSTSHDTRQYIYFFVGQAQLSALSTQLTCSTLCRVLSDYVTQHEHTSTLDVLGHTTGVINYAL